MKTLASFRWSYLLALLLTIFFGMNIARSVFADAPTKPNARDRKTAERDAKPANVTDFRMDVPVGQFIGGNGIVEPADRETKVASQVPGRIAAIAVKEGQFVHAGDELVRLESAAEQAAYDATVADVNAAQADLTRVLHGNRREDVEAALAAADAAKDRAQLSAGVLERTERVAASGGVTADELDRARRQAAADRALSLQSIAQSRAAVAGSRVEDVLAARARYGGAVAHRDQAKAVLDQRIIRAPIDGEILQVKYRVGEYQAPGAQDPLVIMGDTRTIRVRMDVDERDLARVRMGAHAIVRAPAFPGTDFAAHVVEIGSKMGRKNVRSDDPTERNDTKILEVVLLMETHEGLVVGERVTSYVAY